MTLLQITQFVFLFLILVFPTLILCARHQEKLAFNNGSCKHCNCHLRHFDTDSQGGRGYVCDKCGHYIWISYNVDKNFKM